MQISPGWKRLLLYLGLLAGFIGFIWLQAIFEPENFYRRDFTADYLPAKACLAGINPYTPLPELAKQFAFPLPTDLFRHPTPHSPGLLLLSTPIGLVSYRTANLVWIGFSLLCLLLAILLLLREFGVTKSCVWALALSWMALGYGPLTADLGTGQIDPWLLLLAVGMWLAWRRERQWLGGVLLGGALALKLLAWPFVVFLLLRRQWRALFGAGLTVGAVHLLALAVFGFAAVRDYYLKVGPQVGQLYRGYFSNLALTSWGWRLFQGTGEALELAPHVLVEPLYASATLARIFSLLLPLLLLAVTLWLAWRVRQFDTSFMLLLCASLLLGPISWFHYLTVLILPIGLLAQRLLHNHALPSLRRAALVLALLTALPHHVIIGLALHFGTPLTASKITTLPFAASLIATLPTFFVLGWMALLWRTDGAPETRLELSQPA